MRTLGLNPTEVHTLQFLLMCWKLHTIGENMHSSRTRAWRKFQFSYDFGEKIFEL